MKKIEMSDLIERDGLYYERFADVPFTGKITGEHQGTINDGKRNGTWIGYWSNGQALFKETFKDWKEIF